MAYRNVMDGWTDRRTDRIAMCWRAIKIADFMYMTYCHLTTVYIMISRLRLFKVLEIGTNRKNVYATWWHKLYLPPFLRYNDGKFRNPRFYPLPLPTLVYSVWTMLPSVYLPIPWYTVRNSVSQNSQRVTDGAKRTIGIHCHRHDSFLWQKEDGRSGVTRKYPVGLRAAATLGMFFKISLNHSRSLRIIWNYTLL